MEQIFFNPIEVKNKYSCFLRMATVDHFGWLCLGLHWGCFYVSWPYLKNLQVCIRFTYRLNMDNFGWPWPGHWAALTYPTSVFILHII